MPKSSSIKKSFKVRIYDHVMRNMKERIDPMFFKGLLVLGALVYGILKGSMPVQFGSIWLLSYLVLFSNVITAQQFVVDRYAFISSLGFCIITAYFLSPYQPVFWCVFGL